uniref:Protein SPA1-RELATED 3-like n=1 Tax=Rhizophora mucronata TaxID=61149 RepID=A0A2P2MKG0_RHIMU
MKGGPKTITSSHLLHPRGSNAKILFLLIMKCQISMMFLDSTFPLSQQHCPCFLSLLSSLFLFQAKVINLRTGQA